MARMRITGIALPWFGVSWEYGASDKDIVRSIFVFLENKRVLYVPVEAQTFFWVGQSVVEIRSMLVDELRTKKVGKELEGRLREIRKGLLRFSDALDQIQQLENSGSYAQFEVQNSRVLALGEMRGRVNPVLAELAIEYGIEVEEELAAALQAVAPGPEN